MQAEGLQYYVNVILADSAVSDMLLVALCSWGMQFDSI